MTTLTMKKDMRIELKKTDNISTQRGIVRNYRLINDKYIATHYEDIKATTYTHDDNMNSKFYLKAYKGLNLKADLNYYYTSKGRRDDAIKEWRDNILEQNAYKNKQKKDRTIEVNDVLYTIGGHEQTNVNFYQVTKLVGKMSVEICQISAVIKESNDMTGLKSPLVGDFIGKSMNKRVTDGNHVNIGSSNTAHPLAFELIAGTKIYKSKSFTSYG